MVSLAKHRNFSRPLAKNVQLRPKPVPAGTLTLESLKIAETELRRRHILVGENFFPLWFHAETERNIFLWRRGCSLLQAEDFDFWVDTPRLIKKRLKQLEGPTVDNPLQNPLWGSEQISAPSQEREYLLDFESHLGKLGSHVHALSVVSALLLEELKPSLSERETVVLPEQR